MNQISTFLTQVYVPAIPNYMMVGGAVAVSIAVYLLTKGGLIRHFINHNK